MPRLPRRQLVLLGLALSVVASPVAAQETVRVRGAIERKDGAAYIVKTRDGEAVRVELADKPVFVAMVKASMADIKPGMFVGATAMPGDGGSLDAVEVHIFPEAMRGAGEGHRPWDLRPQATMTNANVDTIVTGVDSHTLTMKYKDGEKKLVVTPQTVVVTYAPGDAAEVGPGTKIFISAAQKQADGSLKSPRITYGKDGLTPPM
ncbi:MAG: hypothetical protein U1E21_12305 [Reyranellaceae bacterium]